MRKDILIVDDDKTNLLMAERLLSDEFNVISVTSGEEAFEYLAKEEPDLIVLDINMPKMDGFEVLQEIKKNRLWKNIPVIFLTADRDTETEVQCLKLGAVDFVVKPFEPEIVRNRIRRTLETEDYRKGLEVVVRKQTARIEKIQWEIIVSLANMIESRDDSTGHHIKRTSRYVEMMIERLYEVKQFEEKLSDEFVYNLYKAAPMHDIGKIKIPDQVLQKPGRLTEEEFEVMKQHSEEGGKILRTILEEIEEKNYIEVAYNVATFHHEKWNGKGYPEGLAGEEIPLEARIMAVADVFDALVSKRCYKEAMPTDKAFDIIRESAGEHFDPRIAAVFLELRPQIEAYLKTAEQ